MHISFITDLKGWDCCQHWWIY